jgi:hypothetical protein
MKNLLPLVLALVAITPAHAESHNHAEEGISLELEITADQIAGEETILPLGISWKECEGNVTGNYIGVGCTSRKMHDEFLPFMKANVLRCTNAGLDRVGGGQTAKVHVIHKGVFADPRHSRRSLHAVGRALDIQQIVVGGKSYDFRKTSNTSTVDRKFFEGFRQCWHSVHKLRGCPNRDSGHPVGTLGWEDKNHKGLHLHASMPFCPSSRGYFTTAFGGTLESVLGEDFDDVEEDAEIIEPFVESIDI